MRFSKEEISLVFNELNNRLERFKDLHFKYVHRGHKLFKTYRINDKYRPVLELYIYDDYLDNEDKSLFRYEFKINDELICVIESIKKGEDLTYIKNFFTDFYELLLENTNIREFYNLKAFFVSVIEKINGQ